MHHLSGADPGSAHPFLRRDTASQVHAVAGWRHRARCSALPTGFAVTQSGLRSFHLIWRDFQPRENLHCTPGVGQALLWLTLPGQGFGKEMTICANQFQPSQCLC